jgi:hypothetical protein
VALLSLVEADPDVAAEDVALLSLVEADPDVATEDAELLSVVEVGLDVPPVVARATHAGAALHCSSPSVKVEGHARAFQYVRVPEIQCARALEIR